MHTNSPPSRAAIKYKVHYNIFPFLAGTAVVSSIGRDNHSLDYGVPTPFTNLDDIILEGNKPIILWNL